MSRSQNIDLEAERRTLIGMLQEADLSESLVRKLRMNLAPKKAEHPPMPTAMTVEQLVEFIRQGEVEPQEFITNEDAIKISMKW